MNNVCIGGLNNTFGVTFRKPKSIVVPRKMFYTDTKNTKSFFLIKKDQIVAVSIIMFARMLFEAKLDEENTLFGMKSQVSEFNVEKDLILTIIDEGQKFSKEAWRVFNFIKRSEKLNAPLFEGIVKEKIHKAYNTLGKHPLLKEGIVLPVLAHSILYQYFIENQTINSYSKNFEFFRRQSSHLKIMEAFEKSSQISYVRDHTIAEDIIKEISSSI